MTGSGVPQALFPGSATSSFARTLEALGGSRSLQNQDSSALSVSGRLTNHDLSSLSVFGSFPEGSEVTIYRACRCLEASQRATEPFGRRTTGVRPSYDPPNCCGSGARLSKILRSLECLGGCLSDTPCSLRAANYYHYDHYYHCYHCYHNYRYYHYYLYPPTSFRASSVLEQPCRVNYNPEASCTSP